MNATLSSLFLAAQVFNLPDRRIAFDGARQNPDCSPSTPGGFQIRATTDLIHEAHPSPI
jgi:hypothetical protein